jgi:hypothetical protein
MNENNTYVNVGGIHPFKSDRGRSTTLIVQNYELCILSSLAILTHQEK